MKRKKYLESKLWIARVKIKFMNFLLYLLGERER